MGFDCYFLRGYNLIVYCIIAFTTLHPQASIPTVAVLDFEGRGISNEEAATLTDRLISELVNTKAVIIVERKLLDKILEEQGLQQAGCTTDDCVAEVGALLGVEFMISGSINKIGKVFTIDAKMFSVETSEAVRTVSKTYRGEIDGLILVIESLAWEIVGLDKERKTTTAVLDFEGRGISELEAITLTDRFRTELGNTKAVVLVARPEMNEVLDEQGFKQRTDCATVECAAEVGALLGVENIVSGSVGKVGNTYTIDAQIIAVGTGATVKTVSQSYRGEVDGLITEIEILAWTIVDLEPPLQILEKRKRFEVILAEQGTIKAPKTQIGAATRSLLIPGMGQFYSGKKKWGYGWIGVEAVLGGLILMSYNNYLIAKDGYNKYNNLYHQEMDPDMVAVYKDKSKRHYDELETAKDQVKLFSGLIIGTWLGNVVHAYLVGPKPGELGYLYDTPIQIVYNYDSNQTQLRWTIALD